jgi:hypothetical protein
MDIGAVVLHKLLEEQSLEAWAKLRPAYFSSAYTSIYAAINKHYNKYNEIPSFDSLIITCASDVSVSAAIHALESLEVPDVSLDLAIDTLVNQFAQNETIKKLDRFIDNVTMMDVEEIKDNLSGIVLMLDEKTITTDKVYSASDMEIFQKEEDAGRVRFPLGLNNTYDSVLGGAYRQELVLIGGKRGSGKSVACSNICTAQYERGKVSVYFTIEMRAHEVFQRNLAILADVPNMSIRQNKLSEEYVVKLAKARADMFIDGQGVLEKFMEHRDRFKFERDLKRLPINKEKQIIIIDDANLTTSTIDLHLQKLKAQYGDLLTVGVVDYANQVVIPGNRDSMYDWKAQIEVSKQLKNLSRKHDICIISPLQIDDNNGIRYAKGLLDATDIALIMDANERSDACITLETTKVRSGPPIIMCSGIDWNTLRISPVDVPLPSKKKKKEPEAGQPENTAKSNGRKFVDSKPSDDSPPWDV